MADLCDTCKTGIAIKKMQKERGEIWMRRHIIRSGRVIKPCLRCIYLNVEEAPLARRLPGSFTADHYVEVKP